MLALFILRPRLVSARLLIWLLDDHPKTSTLFLNIHYGRHIIHDVYEGVPSVESSVLTSYSTDFVHFVGLISRKY